MQTELHSTELNPTLSSPTEVHSTMWIQHRIARIHPSMSVPSNIGYGVRI